MFAAWKKSYDKPRQLFKNRDIILLKEVCIVKAMVFPIATYGCESWNMKAEHWRTDAFELWCWRRLLKVPWTAKRWAGRRKYEAMLALSRVWSFVLRLIRKTKCIYDHKESWVARNWCFSTVVLEKTLESPLDYMEIKPVHPKGNQPWIFTGRTDVEAEIPILWPPDAKNWLIGKDPDVGTDWRQEEKGMTEDKMVRCYHPLDGHEFE